MGAKRFFYVATGVFLLVAAYQLGAEGARAEWEAGVPGQIVGLTTSSSGGWAIAYTSDGRAWGLRSTATWSDEAWVGVYDLPVPAAEVKFLETAPWGACLITKNDEGWVLNGAQWFSAGQFPGGTVSTQRQAFGKTKAAYR